MKTKFLFLIALLSFGINAENLNAETIQDTLVNQAQAQENQPDDLVFFKFKFHFERGRKNEAGICHDRGVCVFSFDLGLLAQTPGGIGGEIRKDGNGNLLMSLAKGDMTANESIDITGFQEGPGTFSLSYNADLPNEIKAGLGLPPSYQIKAGNYQVTETASTYVVNFGK